VTRLEVPQHYDDERRAIWAETVTRLTTGGRIFRADPEILITYVEAVRSHRQASRLLAQTNVMVTRDGKAMENPALAIQRKSAESMARASRSLGLDRIPAGDPGPDSVRHPSPPAPDQRNIMAGGTRDGKGRYSRTVDTARRDADAAALRAQGRTFDQIAAELRFSSRSKAYEAVQRAYADIPYEGVEEARRLDLERIDRLIEHCWAVMEREHLTISQGRIVGKRTGWERDEATGEVLRDAEGEPVPVYEDILDDGPGMTAVREIRGLLERRAKITGYDAPARSRIEVVTPETIEAHIAALEAELARNDPAGSSTA
jgi:P27 family predicted phage terminase small subunit